MPRLRASVSMLRGPAQHGLAAHERVMLAAQLGDLGALGARLALRRDVRAQRVDVQADEQHADGQQRHAPQPVPAHAWSVRRHRGTLRPARALLHAQPIIRGAGVAAPQRQQDAADDRRDEDEGDDDVHEQPPPGLTYQSV